MIQRKKMNILKYSSIVSSISLKNTSALNFPRETAGFYKTFSRAETRETR
jgi:hypothetical protein